jgi:hypothetical protein
MIRDLDADSTTCNTVVRICPHHKLAIKRQDIGLPVTDPSPRHRVIPFEMLQCARAAFRLAVAQALIGDLELSIRATGENAFHD